jgi:polysaccharide biosynthesis/export protein
LKARIVQAYQKYLVNPSIDIIVLRRINILGAVRNPGLYPIDATMTIADALAVAGGATPVGDTDKVEIVRNGERVRARLSQRTRVTESAIRSGDQLYVPERSWLSRNTGIVAAVITASVSIAVTLSR